MPTAKKKMKEFSPETTKFLSNIEGFDFDKMLDIVKAKGWDIDNDLIYNAFVSIYNYFEYRRRNIIKNKAQADYPSNNWMYENLAEIMDTDLTKEPFPINKQYSLFYQCSHLIGGYNKPNDEDLSGCYDFVHDDEIRNSLDIEKFPERKAEFFKRIGSISSKWSEIPDLNMLSTLFDGIIGKDGIYDSKYENILRQVHGLNELEEDTNYAEREKIIKNIRDYLKNIPEDLRSDEQKKALETATNELEVHIPFMREREAFVEETFKKKYMNSPVLALRSFYTIWNEIGKDENHPFAQVIKQLKEGKVPAYDDVVSEEFPFLIMDEILNTYHEAVKDIKKTPEVEKAMKLIADYDQAWTKERANRNREELPRWRAFNKITQDDITNVGIYVENIKKVNQEFGSESKEFDEMIKEMENFSKTKLSGKYNTVSGYTLQRNMEKLEDKVEKYIQAEAKNNPDNPVLPMSLKPLSLVNEDKSEEYTIIIAKGIADNMKNKKNTYFNHDDTKEYTNILDAMEELGKQTDPKSKEFKVAKDKLEKAATTYIEKKGGLNKTAWWDAGERRRQMALLGLSLANPAKADELITEANKHRSKSEKLDLSTLMEKELVGKNAEADKEKKELTKKKINEFLKQRKERLDFEKLSKENEAKEKKAYEDFMNKERPVIYEKEKQERADKLAAIGKEAALKMQGILKARAEKSSRKEIKMELDDSKKAGMTTKQQKKEKTATTEKTK